MEGAEYHRLEVLEGVHREAQAETLLVREAEGGGRLRGEQEADHSVEGEGSR